MKHIKCTNHGTIMADVCVDSRIFSRATIKRAYIKVMMGIKNKMFNALFKKIQFFLVIVNYPSFLKQRILNNKTPGSSTATDSTFAGSIHLKH